MRKVLFLVFFVFQTLPFKGQIAVESFRLLETDLTAITSGTQEIDQNGEVAALIKVVTTQRGFTFDGGMLGIVKTVLKPAEYWVYVPRKLQKITIAHPDLGILRDYYFQIPIEKGRTYELRLLTGETNINGRKTRTTQYLTLKVSPANAIVYVDDELQTLNSEGTMFKLMSIGSHSYRIEAAGYQAETGTVELGREKVELKIALKSSKSTLTIFCDDAEAEIVLNEEVKGKKSWKGTVIPGLYVVEARRFGYYTSFEEIEIGHLEDKIVTIEAPVPICGCLRVESDPIDAAVYVDEKYIDDTPCFIDETAGLRVGEHNVIVKKEGFLPFSATVMLKADEEVVLSNIRLEQENKIKSDTIHTSSVSEVSTDSLRSFNRDVIVHGEKGDVSFKMIYVEAGTFKMGSPNGETDERPVSEVSFSNSYYLSETEVTQALWYAIMGLSPTSDGKQWTADVGLGDNYPAYRISYEDCMVFIKNLNNITGEQFRMPTEAEWEFAAKGGKKTREYSFSGSEIIKDVAWYKENSGTKATHQVKQKMANEIGLYDMTGNVFEWCSDWYGNYSMKSKMDPQGPESGTNRVNRGGAWNSDTSSCRTSYRNYDSPFFRATNLGLRLALTRFSSSQGPN